MKIVAITAPGGPDVLQLADAPDPVAGPGEVVLDVAATAINRADLLQRLGQYPVPPGAPSWPGLEASGTIRSVGEGVRDWSVGEAACALLAGGGYAERVAVPAAQLLPVPAGVSVVDAAALPEAACTVWSNVFMLAGLAAGEWLLVHGGASGIGTLAIQLAHYLGAHVAVTAGSPEKLQRCAALGADLLVDYRREDFVEKMRAATAGRGADVVLDIVGAPYLSRNIEVLARGGRLLEIGLQGGSSAPIDLRALLSRRLSVFGSTLRARPLAEKAAIVSAVRERVWPLVASGAVRPVIHARLPLADAAWGHRLVEASEHVGKVLLVTG